MPGHGKVSYKCCYIIVPKTKLFFILMMSVSSVAFISENRICERGSCDLMDRGHGYFTHGLASP